MVGPKCLYGRWNEDCVPLMKKEKNMERRKEELVLARSVCTDFSWP